MTTRTKYKRGLEKEPNTVYIGRAWGPFKEASKWGNPFKVGRDGSMDEVMLKYRQHLVTSGLIPQIAELKDKVLICWCDDTNSCHGDELIELVEALDK